MTSAERWLLAHPRGHIEKLTGWATCKASDGEGGRTTMTEGGGNAHLSIQARLAAHGPERIGFCVGRNGWEIRPASGQLNPAHSAWLMAIPEEWCEAAIAASRSLKAKKRERSGSKDTETQLSAAKPRRSSRQ